MLSILLWPALALAAPVAPSDIADPRPGGSWVADTADVISEAAEAAMDAQV